MRGSDTGGDTRLGSAEDRAAAGGTRKSFGVGNSEKRVEDPGELKPAETEATWHNCRGGKRENQQVVHAEDLWSEVILSL